MIIRREEAEYVFITQPDHAALARQVMEHCAALQDHPRASSILLAIGEHDNGWAEADAGPLVDPSSGEPLDFIRAPAAVRQGVWPRGVARLSADPWAAALVAHHAVAIYDRYRGDEEWKAFFPRMESLRDSLVAQSNRGAADLLADYHFVRLGDLISLMFCTGWHESQRHDDWIVSRKDDVVSVSPGVFDSASVAVAVPTKRLPLIPYRTDVELHTALAAAPRGVIQGEITGPVVTILPNTD
jgi:hypothetical protein